MGVLATIVDVDALWQAVWTAAVAGLAVIFVYALAVLGASRSLDMSRTRRGGASFAYGVLALLGGAGTIGLVVYGITMMLKK